MLSLCAFILFCMGLFVVRGNKFRLFGVIFAFIFLIVTLFNYSLLYFSGNFLTLSFINVIILSTKDAPLFTFWREILFICIFLVAIILFCIILYDKTEKFNANFDNLNKNSKIKFSLKINKFAPFICLFFAIFALILNPLTQSCIEIFQILNPKYHKLARANLQKLIIKPNLSEISKPKNIVYIYLESFSRDFTNKYPDLTPNLNALSNRLDFTNIEQIPFGAEVTIEGLFASQCGLPFPFFHRLKAKNIKDDFGMHFPNQLICVPEMLREKNFHLSFIKGADLAFQRTDEFLRSRKYDEMRGKSQLAMLGATHFNEWGVDDDEMFNIAFAEFERLSQNNEKFLQVVLNVGMHVPDGFVSQKCQKMGLKYGDGKSKMLNSVLCTDYLVGEFVRKIRTSKWSKNTIIAIQNDHLMPYGAANGIDKAKMTSNKMLFMILDDDIVGVQEIKKYGSSLDTFATLLGYMGVINGLNLGRNILKEESTNSTPNINFIYKTAIMSLDELKYK